MAISGDMPRFPFTNPESCCASRRASAACVTVTRKGSMHFHHTVRPARVSRVFLESKLMDILVPKI
jgi:hypothetical protein